MLGGIPGSPTDHHAAPYSLTEEFVAVYRLHPLIPDDYRFNSLTDPTAGCYKTFRDVEGNNTRPLIDKLGIENMWFSFGLAHPGKLTLGNFPRFLQEFKRIKPPPDGKEEVLDVAAIDVFRDRERAVPRYNNFRRMLRMRPVQTFEELTPNGQNRSGICTRTMLSGSTPWSGCSPKSRPKALRSATRRFASLR